MSDVFTIKRLIPSFVPCTLCVYYKLVRRKSFLAYKKETIQSANVLRQSPIKIPPKFPFRPWTIRPWTIVHGGQNVELAQKIHASRG